MHELLGITAQQAERELMARIRDNAWAARVNFNVGMRFSSFIAALRVTEKQARDAATKVGGIVKCLNREYYGVDSETDNRIIEGSWGKGTQIRPPRDVDVIFVLPYRDYLRFEQRQGNKQSQLLQEIKETLEPEYPGTTMRGDGQVVIVSFVNGHGVEVLPAIKLEGGQFWICNTRGQGSYKVVDPFAEIQAIENSHNASQQTTRELVQMLKRWQVYCGVPLKSFQIELLVIDFLQSVTYGLHTRGLYDWLVKDFFRYLVQQASGYVLVPGTFEIVWLGEEWKSRAESAHARAIKASAYEEQERHDAALDEWQKIFGVDIQ